jgi:hypothetical protein
LAAKSGIGADHDDIAQIHASGRDAASEREMLAIVTRVATWAGGLGTGGFA